MKKIIPKEKRNCQIGFRCNNNVSDWYKNFANKEKVSVSELLNQLPALYDYLELEYTKLKKRDK